MPKKMNKKTFDFDCIPAIIGSGIQAIEKELVRLIESSEVRPLDDSESKKLISYLSVLREIKKDNAAEEALIKKELKGLSNEELISMLDKN